MNKVYVMVIKELGNVSVEVFEDELTALRYGSEHYEKDEYEIVPCYVNPKEVK